MFELLVGFIGAVSATPSPSPSPAFDPTTVTPGWVGFVITFVVAVLTVVLILDMNRRVRRVRYRSEVTEMLDAEDAAAEDTAARDPQKD